MAKKAELKKTVKKKKAVTASLELQLEQRNAELALENAHLFEETQRLLKITEERNAELAVINSVQASLAAKLDMQAIYDAVGDKIQKIFDAQVVDIGIYDRNEQLLHFPYTIERGVRFPDEPIQVIGFRKHVMETRQPLLINQNNPEVSAQYGNPYSIQVEPAKSILYVPVLVGGEAIGVLSLQNLDHENAFSKSDVSLLTTLTNAMSVALENARLFDETQHYVQEITTLADIGQEISSTLDLPTVLQRIASRALELLRARDVVIRLLEPDGSLPAVVAIGKYADIYKKWDAHIGRGLSGDVAQTGVAEIINDPESDPRVIDIPGTEGDKATRVILFAPMMIGEDVIGVLSVWRDKTESGLFAQVDLDFGLNLARQAAIAIQNARLFAETQQRFKETEILRSANVALTQSLDLDTILAALLDHLQQIVPYDTGSVFLLEEDETHLTAMAARGYEKWVENANEAVGVSFEYKNIPHIRSVIEDQTIVVIPDVTKHSSWVVAKTAKHVRNWLAVPLVAAGKTIGMYSLDKIEADYFTPEHQRLAVNLAAQAAIAFQNATLFRNQQVAREQAETLRAVAQSLGSTLSLREVFELILSELRKVVPYDSCSVQQLDGNEMVIVGGHGFPNLDELLGNRFDWRGPDDPAGEVVRRREPVIITDVSARFEHFKDETHGQGRVHGWLGVPLLFGERLIGMLTLDKLEKDYYTLEHAHMAQAFATQAATAIENARLFETEKIARQQAETLRSAALALGSTLSLQRVFELILSELRKVVPYDSCSVQQLDGNEMVIVGGHGFPNLDELLGNRFDWRGPDDPAGDVVRRREPVIIMDVSARFEHFKDETHGQGRVHGWLGVPLMFGDRLIGMITLDKLEKDFYTPEHAHMAQAFATQAATAIENARLFDETQRLLKITEERAQELAILNSVGEAMAKTLDVKTVTRIVGDKVRDIFGAEVTEILLRDANSDLIHVPYAFAKEYQDVEPFAMGTGLTSKVILSGKPLVLGTMEQGIELGALYPTEEDRTESYMGVPIVAGEKMLGVVSVQSYEQNAYNENHVRLLQTLSSNMGVAIENARLFDETQRLLKITEDRNAELAIINSVQEGLASKLEMQAIYDLIGDKIRDIFDAQVVDIGLLDPTDQLLHFPYIIERGERFPDEPMELIGFRKHVIQTQQSLLINENMVELAAKYGNPLAIQGETSKACLYVPMQVGGEAKGVISLQNLDRENAFSDSDVSLLTTLANAMSVALENARLFDETQRLLKITEDRAQELAIINSVQEGLASKLIMQAIYDLIGDKIRDIFDAQVVDIGIYDRNEKLLHFPYAIERGVRFPDEPMGLIGYRKHVMETRQPLLINEDTLGAAEKYGNPMAPLQGEVPKSILYVPMLVGGEAIGVISLQNLDHENAFSDSDVSLLTTLTNAMSVALENARLFDETQRLLKVTEERAAELSAISKVSQALIVESELDSTIQLIGSQMREIFSADIVYLALLNPHTNLIHFPYQYGESFEPLAFGEGLTSKIIQTGEPLLINQNLNERREQIGATLVGKEALSYLGVPIKTGKGTIGVISVQSTTQEGLFDDDSLRLLTTIAANAGAALHNAQLFSEALENLRQVEILTNAASAIEQSAYEPAMVESVAARTDALGELARVFAKMADEVRMREQRLKRQLAQMQLDIEEKKLAKAETVAIYIPMDRRQAMAQHISLPERAHGAALFADVSGFTALTESLANELGLQRGAEEMIRHLNRVFTVLIDEVHRYSGAVISFSGDAITCWFDDLDLNGNPRTDASVERAAACAFAMQKGMTQFAAIATPNGKTIGLSIKVALAVGPTRRMAVGEGSTHQIDVLAGATLTALANAEHESERGEVVLATANLTSVEEKFNVTAWREEKQFAVLTSLKNEVAPSPWAEIGSEAIIKSRLRPWMHPTVFEKVRAGQSDMLSELRPATALFMKFGGLDYDNDPEADKKLNAFMQWVEGVIAPHNGSIIQFTVGDKGSYIYIVFGAPSAHRDDAAQAVFTALELASPPESLSYMTDLFIGLASGQMRVGAYGGAGHRTYGAIGDRTNLAARLMVAASKSSAEIPEGQRALILCNESVYDAAKAQVEFESMPRINVKGKTETIAIYRPLRKLSEHEINSDASFEHTQRIDDLPAGEQLTLKVASVIGQMFTLESLSAIYPENHTKTTLQKHLQTLTDLGLIHKRPNEASSYNFKDQQTHEAAYNLMLFAQRRQLHRAVAELLEQTIFSVPPYAEIAHHWQSANEIPKAIEYLEKAGEHARQMGDFSEATRFFNESLALNK